MKKLPLLIAGLAVSALSGSVIAGPGEDAIAANKCNKCHTATTTKKAPSFASLATKYKGDAGAADKLYAELKKGGKVGDETDHKKMEGSDADIKAAVGVVLGSK